MQKLFAPWRTEFILGKKEKGCIFCKMLKENKDRKNFILFRGEKSFIIMNRFPYNPGHLMACTNRHIGKFENLTESEVNDLMKITQLGIKILKSALKPQDLNLGMNLGKVSGAGVASHLHIHIVPRWNGDTNFMPILAKTKVVSIGMDEIFVKLKKSLDKLLSRRSSNR